jgi:hypothetical protein
VYAERPTLRTTDVSSIKVSLALVLISGSYSSHQVIFYQQELARRWYPGSLKRAEVVHHRGPRSAHDIRASIEELKIYRQSVFLTKEEFAVRNQSAAVEHTQAVTSDVSRS